MSNCNIKKRSIKERENGWELFKTTEKQQITVSQIQRTPSRTHRKKNTSKHTIGKVIKSNYKEKNLKVTRE